MSRDEPQSDCAELRFPRSLPLPDGAEMALEDYARTLTGADRAEVMGGADGVLGIHVCHLPAPVPPAVRKDIEDFASELVAKASGGGGLGWS
jgi:hypothetical protein